mmetsp:Transcript_81154/g.161432  ORF Transcript_81154/g.161432 Transcript_81154/m.161432 type:complete len:234 (-) Transcript_81154:7-708(-)
MLRVTIDNHRCHLNHLELDHEEGEEGNEAEHGELTKHRLQDVGHHRWAAVLEIVLDNFKKDGHTDQHHADPKRHLHIKGRVDVVTAVQQAVVLLAMSVLLAMAVLLAAVCGLLRLQVVTEHCNQPKEDGDKHVILQLLSKTAGAAFFRARHLGCLLGLLGWCRSRSGRWHGGRCWLRSSRLGHRRWRRGWRGHRLGHGSGRHALHGFLWRRGLRSHDVSEEEECGAPSVAMSV